MPSLYGFEYNGITLHEAGLTSLYAALGFTNTLSQAASFSLPPVVSASITLTPADHFPARNRTSPCCYGLVLYDCVSTALVPGLINSRGFSDCPVSTCYSQAWRQRRPGIGARSGSWRRPLSFVRGSDRCLVCVAGAKIVGRTMATPTRTSWRDRQALAWTCCFQNCSLRDRRCF